MGALSPTHWLIAIGVLVLLFGAKRLPDAARSLGRSARILKAEVKDMGEGSGEPTAPAPHPRGASPVAVPAPAPTVDNSTAASHRGRAAGDAAGSDPGAPVGAPGPESIR